MGRVNNGKFPYEVEKNTPIMSEILTYSFICNDNTSYLYLLVYFV